jgi:hypothetical protein
MSFARAQTWVANWRDFDADGRAYFRYGIVVGPPSSPAAARQPVPPDCGYDRLRDLAEAALPELVGLLGYLECEIITLGRVTPDTLREALYPKRTVAVVAPIKARDRSEEKVTDDSGGDWTRLTDVLRASVACDSLDEVRRAISTIESAGLPYARPPKDRFEKPLKNGYRDFQANYVLPCGLVCEVQFHLKNLLISREEGAYPYHFERTPPADLTAQERSDADATERSRRDANYREATRQGVGRPCKRGERADLTRCVPASPEPTEERPAPKSLGDIPTRDLLAASGRDLLLHLLARPRLRRHIAALLSVFRPKLGDAEREELVGRLVQFANEFLVKRIRNLDDV